MTRLIIYKDGEDISNDCKLKNGKSNPFGWSQYEIHHKEERIGWLESGSPMDFKEGYAFKEVEEPNDEYLQQQK